MQQSGGGVERIKLSSLYVDNSANPVQCEDFMLQNEPSWGVVKVQHVYLAADAHKILRCSIAPVREDMLIWEGHSTELVMKRCQPTGSKREMCEQSVEDVLHALRDCPLSKEVLSYGRVPEGVRDSHTMSTKEWLIEAAGTMDASQFTGLIVVLWNILNRRNKKVHDAEVQFVALCSLLYQMLVYYSLNFVGQILE
ncbi:hypothetical protein V6N11_059157 [Hibiscus sabdariffa]|uniref:Uncharacterized protein n=1 Tax=Hibiscus sabdariffa TaxID=183260 RepID=A0ABR2U6D0_9ROSI